MKLAAKFDQLRWRRWIMVGIVVLVFGAYLAKLINVQIVQSDAIREELESTSYSTQSIRAVRGEIVDRNGKSLVVNELGYDVIFDMVSFPLNEQNDIILRLTQLFEENNATWIDNLPITKQAPYSYLTGEDSKVSTLKSYLNLADYATAEDAMYHLIEEYDLQGYSEEDARTIAGVRYEMERCGFELNLPYTFASDVDIDLMMKVKEHNFDLPGVDIEESAIRKYALGDVAPHLIGQTGPIYKEELADYVDKGYSMDSIVGKSGVEQAFESDLRGTDGERHILLNSREEVLGVEESEPAEPGNTVYLTIDADLQKLLQKALEAQIKVLQTTAAAGMGQEADYGAAVVIQVKTGQVLACATYPSYDLNTFSENYEELSQADGNPLLNRAFQGVYAPGSIFKPVVGTAGMATGVIDENSTVYCGKVYSRFTTQRFTCLSAHGDINLSRALSVSCNIFFYETGWNVGIDKIDLTAKQYGLGEATGIELAESVGQRSNPETYVETTGEEWTSGNVVQSAIGQLVQRYTPLQLANYAATIANRGERMKVTILKEVRDYARENVLRSSEAQVVDHVDADTSDIEAVIAGMIEASRTGSARAQFANYPIDVAAKTGTPEATMLNSTFISFAPAQDPEIAVAVVIENGYHGYTSAPVARAVYDKYFGFDNANPLVSEEELAEDTSEASSEAGEDTSETDTSVGNE